MIFFYIRHGDPVYEPDSLTPLGMRQADALAKRLSLYGVDKIYSSTSNRAIQTAKPTCELMKIDMELLDFANEGHAWNDFTIQRGNKTTWLFQDYESKVLFADNSVISLGNNWFEHPLLAEYKQGIDRVYNEAYEFFKSLGYEHIRNTGSYKVVKSNDERIALFALQGFGLAFLSVVLDIPYPIIANHFDMCHTGITAIEFKEENGYAIPKILTLSSDAHLYKEGLPTKYNNILYL